MSENKVIWYPIEEGYPPGVDEVSKYLVTLKYFQYIDVEVAIYSDDLYKFNEHDFSDFEDFPKEERKGFVWYDSQFGYHTRDDVIAWAYLPEPYKGD